MGHVVSTCECRYVVEMFKRKKTKQNQTNQPVLTMSVYTKREKGRADQAKWAGSSQHSISP